MPDQPSRQPDSRPRRVRISGTDWLVIWSAVLLTIALERIGYPGWWLPAMVVAHFFLFCNVFRVPRRWELVWAGLFALNTGIWLALGSFDWRPVLLVQTPFTLAVIGVTLVRRQRESQNEP